MGRLVISNNDNWLETLKKSQQIAGMKLNTSVTQPISVLCYHKYRLENENFYKDETTSDFVAVSGSLVYKNRFGLQALKELLSDYKKLGLLEVRKNLVGNFSVAIGIEDEVLLFVDQTGTYSNYYYHNPATAKFLITNTFYHVQKCAKQPIKEFEFLEYVLLPGIFDNQSPFENISRLGGNEVIRITKDYFRVEKVDLNRHELKGKNFDEACNQLAEAIMKNTKAATAIPYKRLLFLTGGVDSRLLLSAHLAVGSNISIGNWQGAPIDMNSKEEDGQISKSLADSCHVEFQYFDVAHNVLDELDYQLEETYERYGEYASIYGNNRRWFEIFETAPNVYWDSGLLGESLRDVEELELAYYEGITLKSYYSRHLKKQCADYSFTGNELINVKELDDHIYQKFFDYCISVGIDVNNLKKRDCYQLHNFSMLHSETLKANMYNINGFYISIYSQKEVFDLGISIDPDFRKNKKLIISMIDRMCPSLNEIDYFTRCRFMKYDSTTNSLQEINKAKLKSIVRDTLNKTALGAKLLDVRTKRNDRVRANKHNELISKSTNLINKSAVMNLVDIKFDNESFVYFPYYVILWRSCQYMDRIL